MKLTLLKKRLALLQGELDKMGVNSASNLCRGTQKLEYSIKKRDALVMEKIELIKQINKIEGEKSN